MKKLLLVVFCCLIVLGSGLTASAITIPDELDVDQEILDDIDNLLRIREENNETTMGFHTVGPRNMMFSKFTIDKGTLFDKFDLLTTVFLRIFFIGLPLFRPISFFLIDDETIDFTVEYKRSLPADNLSRFHYLTGFETYEDGNWTNETNIYNTKHTVKVEGFYGAIDFTKRSALLPPTMMIVGLCDNVTLIK